MSNQSACDQETSPPRIGYLGPPGSYSHLAAVLHFGDSADCIEHGNIEPVFVSVEEGLCEYGLAPYENSTGGSITDTLDAFHDHNVRACAEVLVEINHCLLSNAPTDRIVRVASRPQVLGQCNRWLADHFPDAERVEMASSSLAVQSIADAEDSAAIGSVLAGTLYGVDVLHERIQDKSDNVTRFLVISREDSPPVGRDKTTMSFITSHEPGALVDVLAVFRDAGINLSHIDKRPSRRENWQYKFYIDTESHRQNPSMQAAIDQARSHCIDFNVLGSYPRAVQVL